MREEYLSTSLFVTQSSTGISCCTNVDVSGVEFHSILNT